MRYLRWLLLAALVVAGCGSDLSEEEVLARSGGQVDVDGGSAAQGPGAGGTTTTVLTPAGDATGGPLDGGATGSTTPSGAAQGPGPASSACSTQEKGPIVIGSVGNYSGPAAVLAQSFPTVVRAWAADLNRRGGLCGRQVQVLVRDDGGDPARYGALVRDLVETSHVVAFVGNGAPLSAQGGIAYHNSSRVPVFGNDCGHPEYFTSPVIAVPCPRPTDMAIAVMESAARVTNGRRFGYLVCGEAQACAEQDRDYQAHAAEAGVTIAFRDGISIAQVDFTAECQSARGQSLDFITVLADPNTLARVARSCARQGYTPQYVQLANTMAASTIEEPGLGTVILASSVFPFGGGDGPAIDAFETTMRTHAAGRKPDGIAAFAWASAKLFENVAIRAARADQAIDAASLVRGLHTVRGETLGGLTVPLTFSEQGASPARCYFVFQGDGKGGYTLPLGPDPQCID